MPSIESKYKHITGFHPNDFEPPPSHMELRHMLDHELQLHSSLLSQYEKLTGAPAPEQVVKFTNNELNQMVTRLKKEHPQTHTVYYALIGQWDALTSISAQIGRKDSDGVYYTAFYIKEIDRGHSKEKIRPALSQDEVAYIGPMIEENEWEVVDQENDPYAMAVFEQVEILNQSRGEFLRNQAMLNRASESLNFPASETIYLSDDVTI